MYYFTACLHVLPGWRLYKPPEDIAQSLPVSIGAPSARRFGFNKTTLADRQGLLVADLPLNKPTSEVSGEPSDVEGDQSRKINSTALDTATRDDEGDEGDDMVGDMVEGRGHQRALRILQARSEVPEAGMWRSLA
jgi:hypothetical protein